MVDVKKGVSLVHLNVGSGYLTYIDEDHEDDEESPKVKNVVLETRQADED